MIMDSKQYVHKINYSLKKMDIGEFEEALNLLEIMVKSNFFKHLKYKENYLLLNFLGHFYWGYNKEK